MVRYEGQRDMAVPAEVQAAPNPRFNAQDLEEGSPWWGSEEKAWQPRCVTPAAEGLPESPLLQQALWRPHHSHSVVLMSYSDEWLCLCLLRDQCDGAQAPAPRTTSNFI